MSMSVRFPDARRMASLGLSRNPYTAILLVAATIGIGIRIWLATLPGFQGDLQIFRDWAQRLAAEGPGHFYDNASTSDYTPGYLWVLWLLGGIDRLFHLSPGQWVFALKLPSIVADSASAVLL